MSSGPGSSQPGRVARAATRYRPGKAPIANDDRYSSDSDSDDDEDDQQERRRAAKIAKRQDTRDEAITDISSGTAALKNNQRRTAGVVIQSNGATTSTIRKPVVRLDDVKIGGVKKEEEEDFDSDEYETDTDEELQQVQSKPVFKKPSASATTAQKKESSSEYETDSDDEEESEEDNRPMMLKPIFVSKKQRETMKQPNGTDTKRDGIDVDKGAYADQEEMDETTRKAQILAEERRKQSHMLAAETIKRELAEKDHEEGQPDLSDTDGKDPEEEFQAWRIRELTRLKEEGEAMKEKESEREEMERRRAMPEAQRLVEDTRRAEASREEKRKARQEASGGTFMQKYHHKGSFFADDELLKNRDSMAKTESAVDISLLPKVMQVRDYGKAGRSKWTHLANEDTSRKQEDHRMKGISGGDKRAENGGQTKQQCFSCGGPHLRRDCPQQKHGNGLHSTAGPGRGAISTLTRDNGYQRERRRSRSPPDRRRDDYYSRGRDR